METLTAIFGSVAAMWPVLLTVGAVALLGVVNIQGVLPADKWAQKMLARAKNAGNDWVEGMQNPTVDPKAAALAAQGKWKQKMQDAITNNAYAKGIANYSPDQAVATAIKVGASGYVAGITAREDKITAAIAKLQPQVASLKAKINAMPQDTDQQREARLLEARRGMLAIGKKA